MGSELACLGGPDDGDPTPDAPNTARGSDRMTTNTGFPIAIASDDDWRSVTGFHHGRPMDEPRQPRTERCVAAIGGGSKP
jgi:hypothetical protein